MPTDMGHYGNGVIMSDERYILIKTEDNIENRTGVADAIQVEENKIQLVKLDKSTELVNGWLFGASGCQYKVWLKSMYNDKVEKYEPVVDPITYPENKVRVDYGEVTLTRYGKIARLKMIESEA